MSEKSIYYLKKKMCAKEKIASKIFQSIIINKQSDGSDILYMVSILLQFVKYIFGYL